MAAEWLYRLLGRNDETRVPAGAAASSRVPLRTRTGGGRESAALHRLSRRAFSAAVDDGAAEEYPPGGPAVFARMQRDAQVRACLATKRLSVLSEGVETHPAGDTPAAKRAASLVGEQLHNCRGGVARLLSGAMDALAMGYAIGELIWAENGTLETVTWHDPRRFALHGDAWGAVAGVEVLDVPGILLEPSRFVLFTYQGRYGSPFGESDLVAAYEPWTRKQLLSRMWLTALDRFGTPPVVGKFPLSWSQQEADDLAGKLARLQSESSLTIPNTVEVDFAGQSNEPGAGFEGAVAFQNREIARAILGQELTTQAGGGSGSYALGRVHASVQDDWIQALRADLAGDLLTGQIARRVVEFSLGPEAAALVTPRVAFPNLTPDELSARRELIGDLVRGGIVAPDETWIRTYLGLPEGVSADSTRKESGSHATA